MLIALLDKKGKIEKKKPKFVRQDDAVIVRLEVASGAVCLELFKDYAQLGRFTLRDKGMSCWLEHSDCHSSVRRQLSTCEPIAARKRDRH